MALTPPRLVYHRKVLCLYAQSTTRYGARPSTFDIRKAWMLAFYQDITKGKRIGQDRFLVLCPFHDEKTASCAVHLSKNAFYCHGCEAHGGTLDVIVLSGFAQTRHEAAKWLKDRGAL